MTLLIVIAAISEIIAIWCVVGLWRGRTSLWRKLIWTMVLLIPVIGPVFYGGMFELPEPKPSGLQAEDNWGDDGARD